MAEVCFRAGEVVNFRLAETFELEDICVCALPICIEVVGILGIKKSRRGSDMA